MQQEKNYRFAPGVYPQNNGTPRCNEGDTGYARERSQMMPRYGGCDEYKMVLGMAYVKSQPFENLYSPNEAWHRGTLFADLDLPYGGGKC